VCHNHLQLRVQISRAPAEGSLNLVFFNLSTTEEAYLDRIKACVDGTVRNDLFIIRPVSNLNQQLNYLGPSIQIRGSDDQIYQTLPPGESFSTVVNLIGSYDFHQWRIRGVLNFITYYQSFHWHPLCQILEQLRSNEITVVFSGA